MDAIHIGLIIILVAILWVAGRLLRKVGRLRRQVEDLRRRGQDAQQRLHEADRQRQAEDEQHGAAEKRLRRYLIILDTLINTIPHPIYFKDQSGIFRGCNQAFAEKIIGLPRSKIIDRQGKELGPEAPGELVQELERREVKLAARQGAHTSEATVRCQDGNSRDFLISLAVIPAETEHGAGCVGVLLDMTDRNRAAEERVKREKFQGVIETAGAVCHELNQPLQALSGYTEMLNADQSTPPEMKRMVATIQSQIRRLAEITGKLQRITRYKTQSYGNGATIIDIDKASQAEKPFIQRSKSGN